MDRLPRLAAAHGVATSYEPSPGRRVNVPEDTVAAVLTALGVDPGADPDEAAPGAGRLLPPTVAVRGTNALPPAVLAGLPHGTALRITTGDGRTLALADDGTLPAGTSGALPPGYHTLRATAPDGRAADATLIAAPARLPGAPGRSVGLLVQLYSLLSARSWGMGDLVDLADLATWAGHVLGAGFIQLNPLHAAVPGGSGEATDPSPYRPGTRRYADPVHLRIEDIPEYAYLGPEARHRTDRLIARAAALRTAVLEKGAPIDRDAVWALKRQALEIVRAVPLSPGRYASYWAFLAEQGQALEDHATWCALAELHGPDWRSWSPGLRDPRSPETARARGDHLDRIDFHSWLAWLTDIQLRRAQRSAQASGMTIGLVHDLALGVHPNGSDAWAQQGILASGMSAGAPPDAFNADGQDWGLPPWRPDALAEHGYAPYRELLAGLLRHAGGLRVDHVMGQFRLWWIPEGAAPSEGTYVTYDADAMLGVLALEAERAGAVVIGEDLGTVEPGVREELADRGVAGTSVLWFERDWAAPGSPPLPPEAWRADCLATVTTHDLPSTAARLAGDHVRLRERLGLLAPGTGELNAALAESAEWQAVFARLGLLPPGATEEGQIAAAYRFLARTPARMIGIWLPDMVGDRRPQNLPGTWREYPNWRLPVADGAGRPVTLEELTTSARVTALVRAVREEMAGS
ncbi:4-alpha-glucanotransferase [Streptomyces sp. RFCAC02]|uniref:4-alpha-glucanotransferase n=1 Tax=Streptomyces sp. RFCAC02 TaxID=2499143 RepID=UPI00102057AC|nr:4-alpha-glucanotransferase [Streptomyces sp. RFCAC02]